MSEPLVCMATERRFSPGWQKAHGPVGSVRQLWCRAGEGLIRAAGEEYLIHHGCVLLLPWNHHISYRNIGAQRWEHCSVHVVPSCTPPPGRAPRMRWVPHGPGRPDPDLVWCGDASPPILTAPLHRQLGLDHRLVQLAEYVVRCFRQPNLNETHMRACARILCDEWRALVASPDPDVLPAPLQRIKRSIEADLGHMRSLDDWAERAGISRSTLARLARRHWRCGVHGFHRQRQLERAQDLLRVSDLAIAAIAQQCGFSDPHYFSRVFRDQTGHAPRQWRRIHAGP